MSRTELDWRDLAMAAENLIGREPQGRRVAATVAAAETLQVGVQTLRRFMFAHRFLEALPVEARKIALKMPAIAVATAARWHTHDPEGAINAILAYYPDRHTLRSFSAAEAAARTARRGARGARLANLYSKQVEDRFSRGSGFEWIWSLEEGWDPITNEIVSRTDQTGKVGFFAAARSGKPVAVLVVGPYATPRMYSERAADWCLRALGVATVHRRAALVLPHEAPASAFSAFLEGLPADVSRRVEVLRDTLAPGERAPRIAPAHHRRGR